MTAAQDVSRRVERFSQGSDLTWVARLLAQRRDEILDRWLEAAAGQPFHEGRRDQAVADHIPRLFDALVQLLERSAPRSVDAEAPLDDPPVLQAARGHAQIRLQHGLQPADIVTEFRLLRQEIGRALHVHLADGVPTRDVVGAELLVHDAIDGAISVGLAALARYVETVREDFLATTVHDVRQPITAISAALQLAARALRRSPPDVARLGSALGSADAATRRMTALLDTLADASQLAVGRLQLHPAPVDLLGLVRDSVGRLDPETAARVRLHAPPDQQTTGRWDASALSRVIDNLLSNALKYSPEDRPVEVTIQVDPESVHLRVRDQGIGLEPDELAQLFRRYGRARGGVERGIQGLGLGLYLSRGIVEAHGGRVWAESAGRDQGATMHVVLPMTAEHPEPAGAASPT